MESGAALGTGAGRIRVEEDPGGSSAQPFVIDGMRRRAAELD